mgnify:CR=1 FL=1|tara:strand:+ start:11525 stop:11986 length:462 start_codon:yes stop_codon:yes gene_type:complete
MKTLEKAEKIYQTLYGKDLSYGLTIRLIMFGHQGSKKRFLKYHLPGAVPVFLAGLLTLEFTRQGNPVWNSLLIALANLYMYFHFCLRPIWIQNGIEYLRYIDNMFGPKTARAAVEFFLEGEICDIVEMAKIKNEYNRSNFKKLDDLKNEPPLQ